MAFKATNDTPEEVYALAKKEARRLKTFADNTVIALNAPVSAERIPVILNNLTVHKNRITQLLTIGGIEQYAKDQENDQTYSIIAETNALIVLIDAARLRIQAFNTNQLINGWLDSGVDWNTFTAVQTANLRTDIQAISDSVT
jgi:acid phosphatase family membrane protein YuiD